MIERAIRKVLREEFHEKMVINESVEISDALKYHVDNNIPLNENIYRIYSESFFDTKRITTT